MGLPGPSGHGATAAPERPHKSLYKDNPLDSLDGPSDQGVGSTRTRKDGYLRVRNCTPGDFIGSPMNSMPADCRVCWSFTNVSDRDLAHTIGTCTVRGERSCGALALSAVGASSVLKAGVEGRIPSAAPTGGSSGATFPRNSVAALAQQEPFSV